MTSRIVRTLSTVTLIPLLGLLACSDSTGPDAGPPEPITELPRELSALEQTVLSSSNQFAFDLGEKLLPDGPDENLFFSPLSASMFLGMLSNGADGATWEQIRSVLHLDGLSQAEMNQGYADLVTLLLELDPSVTVEIGNSAWTRTGVPILPDFRTRVEESFDAEVEEVDFSDPATVDRINAWVEEATNGLIPEIFAPRDVDEFTIMALLNALYFKGDWITQFDPDETETADFTRSDASTVPVPLMKVEEAFPYSIGEDASVVELPYGGGAFTMVVVVPHEGVDVNTLTADLDDESWRTLMDGLHPGRVVVRLPRFELDWGSRLNDTLKALGMTDAFHRDLADFSRLTPDGPLWLTLVKQKAFVKVDEVGTEAAAVTGGIGGVDGGGPPTIRADHPFLFAIRERLTGTILFMGVVNDPTE